MLEIPAYCRGDDIYPMVMHFSNRPVAILKRAAFCSLVVGTVILVIKFIAYTLTGSAAILSDAAESIVNVVTAGFALYSVRVSAKPADECHPYGHGKIEFFSAAIEGGAIIVAAFWIIYKAMHELATGSVLHQLDIGVWLVAVAALINAMLGWYLIRTGKKEGSLILVADGRHVMTDVYTSAGVVAGLVIVVITRWLILDSVIAIFVALNIIYAGWKLLKLAGGGMMDAASPEDDRLIKGIIEDPTFGEVCAYHKLRHRISGNTHFVDFHLILPKYLSIEHAHAVATAVEARVASSLVNASVMAHIEPCKRADCPRCKRFTAS